jgi:hypothetical protein
MRHIKEHAKKVHHARHAHLGMHSTSQHPGHHHASGGHTHHEHTHSDAAEDRAMIRHMVKPEALNRAHGGGVHHKGHKGKGGTHVNIMVGHPGGGAGALPLPPPGAIPPPPMGARPPMPMPPPGGPMGGPPPGIGGVAGPMPRKRGGGVRHR